jgi:hypothetical protein
MQGHALRVKHTDVKLECEDVAVGVCVYLDRSHVVSRHSAITLVLDLPGRRQRIEMYQRDAKEGAEQDARMNAEFERLICYLDRARMKVGKLEMSFELQGAWGALMRDDRSLSDCLPGKKCLAGLKRSTETTLPGTGWELSVNFRGPRGESQRAAVRAASLEKQAYLVNSLMGDRRKFKFNGLEFGSNEKSFGAIFWTYVPVKGEDKTAFTETAACILHARGNEGGPSWSH